MQRQLDGSQYVEMILERPLDRETSEEHTLILVASDGGAPQRSGTARIHITVLDVNDNAPVCSKQVYKAEVQENSAIGTVSPPSARMTQTKESMLMSFSSTISEDAPPGTTLAVINVHDDDSERNVTDDGLDRESVSEYNITLTVTDQGSPPLSTTKTIQVKVADVNDNSPKFDESEYSRTIPENNSPGFSIFTVRATDADWGQNARISYFLEEININDKEVYINVTARDAGSPPLSSVISVKILVQDQNDNALRCCTQSRLGLFECLLSYKLQKAADRALFEVGSQNGEIRTIRQVTDKDAVKQRLAVIVEDNGQPSRSATVIVNVAVADSFPEVLSEFTDFTHDKEYNDNLTFYLVLALAVVSFLFITCVVVIISVKIYRWRQSRILYHSNLPVIPYYPPRYSDTLGTGTLPHVYNYDTCRTTDSKRVTLNTCSR
ncbi:hypothetical protein WMY93_009628 [Mugilogobius chulae]|uniref:Cadherin domain-containing protein n=1 Tax=Mugilogobius chulae TaxID=88201 RepID=A0AAW0PCA1_9GOBI